MVLKQYHFFLPFQELETVPLGSLRPSTEPKTPKPRKVSKKSPERSLGPPDPDPRKVPQKARKVKKKLILTLFRTFRTFFGTFRGSGSGGPKLLSGDFFETFRGFGFLGSVDGRRDPNGTTLNKKQVYSSHKQIKS